MKKKVTLSLDSEVYKKFQKFCEQNDVMLSKRIERLIQEHLKQGGIKEKVK
jgi:hypothetical protein